MIIEVPLKGTAHAQGTQRQGNRGIQTQGEAL
jgi:hypothetical protein